MIFVPEVPNIEDLIHRHFYSATLSNSSTKGHEAVAIAAKSGDWDQAVKETLKNREDDGQDIYTLGFDWSKDASELLNALYLNSKPNKVIHCIPCLEDPDRVQYIYKQRNLPGIAHFYNAEPYISYDWPTVRLYYNTVCHPEDFAKSGLMLDQFGDFWKVQDSDYEHLRMQNVRDLVCSEKIKHVFDIGSYLGQLDDLLEMNDVEVTRTDMSSEVLLKDSRIYDMKKLSADQIAELMQDCVLFASVLFAYDPMDEYLDKIIVAIKKRKPKYIVYEDSALNFINVRTGGNRWTEYFSQLGYSVLHKYKHVDMAIEPFYNKKNIRRHGSIAMILQHYEGESK